MATRRGRFPLRLRIFPAKSGPWPSYRSLPTKQRLRGLPPSPWRQPSFSSLECLPPALLQACAWAKSFQEENIINSLSARSCQGLPTRRLHWKTWLRLISSS